MFVEHHNQSDISANSVQYLYIYCNDKRIWTNMFQKYTSTSQLYSTFVQDTEYII